MFQGSKQACLVGCVVVMSLAGCKGETDADRLAPEVLQAATAASAGTKEEKTTTDKPVDFATQVLPILSDKCFACHGPDTRRKDIVRLDSFEAATRDLSGYKALNPDKPEESEILFRLTDKTDPMPPIDAKPLSDAERDLITRWVKQGGAYAKHWAFVPPTNRLPKALKGSDAIDHAIHQQLSKNKIDFAKEADRATLARRVSLVLTGLPPEPSELDAFLADEKPGAYERFVDQQLQSQRFGEHQARFWLDAVRYGDTHGLHLDSKRGIYPYRDWVVRAFNNNLPIDDFITWQLAGDLLENPTLGQQVATGFVRMNPSTSEGGAIAAEFQAKNSFDRVETVGTVLMGMTMQCARCHTHKYDPITHTEYFELYAFFNNTEEKPLDGNKYDYRPFVKAPADQAGWDRLNEIENLASRLLLKAKDPADENAYPGDPITHLDSIIASKDPGLEPYRADASALKQRMAELSKTFTTTLVAKELAKPRETKLLDRGEYSMPTGDPLTPSGLDVLGELPEGAPANRLGMAQWLTAREHPLTSRVMVNQIWQRTFGYGLVRTPEDFGLQGEQSTHPELLDWLAVELQDSEWDLKHMLRLMVNSKTFKQRSVHRKEVDDPENKLFARGPGHRLDAEEIRDMALWASGLLRDEMGGEGIKPYQPAGMWKILSHPASNTKQYVPDKGERVYSRSLYVYWKRTSPHPMMTLFDAPSREASCVRRSRTNTSLQSLGLLNETQRIELARALAQRLMLSEADDSARLDLLFKLLASRSASKIEREAVMGLLAQMKQRYAEAKPDAETLLSIGEAPRDAKLDPVEHAAWTQVAITVLASDIAIRLY